MNDGNCKVLKPQLRRLFLWAAVLGLAWGLAGPKDAFAFHVPLSHFLCYVISKGKPKLVKKTVTLNDEVTDDTDFKVKKAKLLCNPANKNEPFDPFNPDDHLVGYKIKRAAGPKFGGLNRTVGNQFGNLAVDVKKPKWLLVPSVKAIDPADPSNTEPHEVDHFNCYKVKPSKGEVFQKRVVDVTDQFNSVYLKVLVKKPKLLCLHTNKNNACPVVTTPPHLMCYKIKVKGGVQNVTVNVINQFDDPRKLETKKFRFLCLPSVLIPIP